MERRNGEARLWGFTLVELLAVIATVAVLASLVLPTLAGAKAKAQRIRCLGNLRQMTFAWTLYTQDHSDWVPLNIGAGAQTDGEAWVRGNLTLDHPPPNSAVFVPSDSTNRLFLATSLLAPHGAGPGIWRCPSDRSHRTFGGVGYPRTRSFSLNVALGYYHPSRALYWPPWISDRAMAHIVRKLGDIQCPGPADCFAFQDEREDSIHESKFVVHTDGLRPLNPAAYKFVAYPGSYHHGAGNLSFADGHASAHKWIDARTRPPLTRNHDLPLDIFMVDGEASPHNPDVQWLQRHAYQADD